MKLRCPYLINPKYYIDPETDSDYEGSYMCDLVDKYCLVEYGNNNCKTYTDFLKESEENN